MTSDVMTMDELVSYLRINRKNINKMIVDGLPYFLLDSNNPNSHKRFRKQDVDNFIIKISYE
jgi:hypothetical protein